MTQPSSLDPREHVQAWAEGRLPPPPCAVTLGMEVLEHGPGFWRARFPVRQEFKQAGGVVQGGFLAAMLDDCLGPAIHMVLAPGQYHATIELKVNYLRPVSQGSLIGEARVVRKGAQTVYAEASLSTEDGELVARASTTSLILPRP